MKFYNELLKLSDEEIEKFIKYGIEYLEEKTSAKDYIGYNIEDNYKKVELKTKDNIRKFDICARCFVPGYIKNGTKIVYGISYDNEGNVGNNGSYYYLDTHDYIIDFCKYIKNYEVDNIYDLLDFILEFLMNYYGTFEKMSRDSMFKMLVDNKGKNIKPMNEHGLSWFKGKGNALCTEYSIMAQNILSVFGIQTYLLIGKEKGENDKPGEHAFNIIVDNDSESSKSMLIDFSNYVKIYDYNFEVLGYSPFIGNIDNLDQDFVDSFLNYEKILEFNEHFYYVINDRILKMAVEQKRQYYVDNEIGLDHKTISNCKKK